MWPDERWKIARRCGAKHISKSKVYKTGGLGALLEVEMLKKCTPSWREAHFEVKMHKALQRRTFLEVELSQKVHVVVARSKFRSQKEETTSVSEHVWKLRRSKSAGRCGAKHISKSKVYKTGGLEAFLEVNVQKVHAVVEVKSVKNWWCGSTFWSSDVEKVHADVMRSKCRAQNFKSTQHSYHFWAFTTRRQQLLQLQLPLHYTNYTTLRYKDTDNYITFTVPYITLHHITLHYTTVHYYNYNCK